MFFANEKPELSTNLWHDFNDKKVELSLILGSVLLSMKNRSYRQICDMIQMIKNQKLSLNCGDVFGRRKAGIIDKLVA